MQVPAGTGRRRRVLAILVAGTALLVLTAYAYSTTSGGSHTSTANILVLAGSQDSIVRPHPVAAPTLEEYAAIARSFGVALAAAERTSTSYRDNAAFLRAAREVQRKVKVTVSAPTGQLVVTARAASRGAADRLANAYADGLVQVVRARSLHLASTALATVAQALARPLASASARRAVLARVRRVVLPLVADKQIEIERPQSDDAGPLVTAAIGAAIALLSVLALLLVLGVWRPRPAAP
jgi:hypothetical protein